MGNHCNKENLPTACTAKNYRWTKISTTHTSYLCITDILNFSWIEFHQCGKDAIGFQCVVINIGQKNSWDKNFAHESREWKRKKNTPGENDKVVRTSLIHTSSSLRNPSNVNCIPMCYCNTSLCGLWVTQPDVCAVCITLQGFLQEKEGNFPTNTNDMTLLN